MAKASAKANQNDLPDQTDDNEIESVIEYSEDIAEATKPDPLPPGTYTGQVSKVTRGVGKDSGKPYLMINWLISAEEMPADFVEKMMIDNLTLTSFHSILEDNPKARFNARRLCEALGAPMGRSLRWGDWVGLEARLETALDKDLEGDPQAKVKRVVPR